MKIHWLNLLLILGVGVGQGQSTFQGMNPNIGVIGDFSYRNHYRVNELGSGFQFNEVEISFRMVLDPYARADFFIAIVPPEEAVELEEGFITLLSLPFSLQARIGHFRNAFGKYNLTHPPETPLATIPLFLSNYFGEEGLAETGVSLSALIPNPWDTYLELNIDILNGDNDISFGGESSDALLALVHLKSFFDITENHTLELGLSAMSGNNDSLNVNSTQLFGTDVIYRWKPLAMGRYRSFTLQSEFLYSLREEDNKQVNTFALFLFSQYQMAKRWFIGMSYDYAGFPNTEDDIENRFSGILTFWPSEFQTIKFQVQQTNRNFSSYKKFTSLYFQWTFIIGAHGAHKY